MEKEKQKLVRAGQLAEMRALWTEREWLLEFKDIAMDANNQEMITKVSNMLTENKMKIDMLAEAINE